MPITTETAKQSDFINKFYNIGLFPQAAVPESLKLNTFKNA